MPAGFRDPLGDGTITVSRDSDGYYALRVFLKRDLDDGNQTGLRHLGTDWNADRDADEIAYATYGGTVAYASANAGSSRGGVVMLNHTLPDGSKYTTLYMHLEHIPEDILNGTKKSVAAGSFLGDSGFVRADWGLHVHYEVREGHQSGLPGVGFGYYGGSGQGTLVKRGELTNGVDYADILNPDGKTVRYLDPLEFTEKLRTLPDPVVANADLVIQNARIDDITVRVGQEVRADWEVKNVGSATAASSVAGVYLSRDGTWSKATDIRVDFNSTTSLAKGAVDVGEFETFTIPTSVSAGIWYVIVVADEDDVVRESNNSNNVWTQKITVSGDSGRADLITQNARIDDSTVRPGQAVRVDWDVKNIGDKAAGTSETSIFLSRDKKLSSSDILLDSESLGTMNIGEKDSEFATFKMPKGLDKGTYYIAIVADAGLSISESSESNNITWTEFNVI